MVAVLASASRASMAPLVTEGKKRLFFPAMPFGYFRMISRAGLLTFMLQPLRNGGVS